MSETATIIEERPPAPTTIYVDPDRPWARWSLPALHPGELKDFYTEFDPTTGGYRMKQRHEVAEGFEPLEDSVVGEVRDRGLKELGWAAKFPADFIGKLSPELRVQVINERLRSQDRRVALLSEGNEFNSVMSAWRSLIPYSATAQLAFDAVAERYGADSVQIDKAFCGGGEMFCRFLTPIQERVTAKKDDILHVGLEIRQRYGTTHSICLYAQRLACLNGMTASEREFSWTRRTEGTIDNQIAWLRSGVNEVMDRHVELVNRARQMAETTFNGEPLEVLREHARAMRLPRRHFEALAAAFREEPGNDEWAILNAFTRLATHGNLPDRTRRAVMLASGNWAAEFEMCTARLPRPIALRLGAELVEEAPATHEEVA